MKYWLINVKSEGVSTDTSDLDINRIVMGWNENDCPRFYNSIQPGDVIIAVEKSMKNCICHYVGIADVLDRANQTWTLKNSTDRVANEVSKVIRANAEEMPGGVASNPWGGNAKSILQLGPNNSVFELITSIVNYAFVDYEVPLKYIAENANKRYVDPNNPEKLASIGATKEEMENLKKNGQIARDVFSLITGYISCKQGLIPDNTTNWMSMKQKVRNCLWSELKTSDRIERNISISLFVGLTSEGKSSYAVTISLRTENTRRRTISQKDKELFKAFFEENLPSGYLYWGNMNRHEYFQSVARDAINDDNYLYFSIGKLIDSDYENQIEEAICTLRKIYEKIVPATAIEDSTMTKQHENSTRNRFIDETTRLLKLKKNIILQGAPGTGKTYNTTAIAVSLLDPDFVPSDEKSLQDRYVELRKEGRFEFVTFHQSMDYEDFVEGLKPVSNEENQSSVVTYDVDDGIFKRICELADESKTTGNIKQYIDKYLQEQCNGFENKKKMTTLKRNNEFYVWWKPKSHTICIRSVDSSFDTSKGEDYAPTALNIEKVKAQAIGEGKENNWEQYASAFIAGVKGFYKIEEQKKKLPYLLIIDEINRGNVSKIFGELITLLESDKRSNGEGTGTVVTLPYSKDPFSVPSNLYILGTMNTTDRSVGNLDYAVRRRFAFVTMKADRDVVEHSYSSNEGLKEKALNLFDYVQGYLKSAHHEMSIDDLMIGHSYFMLRNDELNSGVSLETALDLKIKYEIRPLLIEYEKDGIIQPNNDEKTVLNTWMKENFAWKEEVFLP